MKPTRLTALFVGAMTALAAAAPAAADPGTGPGEEPASQAEPSPELAAAASAASRSTLIPGPLAATVLEGALGGVRVHLDNFGPRHGQSHHLANGSWVSLAGRRVAFTIPDHQVDLDCGFFCPDLGQARFYVDDVNLVGVDVGWSSSTLPSARGFRFDGAFESDGREVKGFFTDATTGIVSDNLMPDVQIDDAHLRLGLVPVADGKGSVTYRRSGPARFDGTIQATGACDVYGVDVRDRLLGYKGKIRDAVQSPLNDQLDAPAPKAAAARAFRAQLDRLGVGAVRSVSVVSAGVVVTW